MTIEPAPASLATAIFDRYACEYDSLYDGILSKAEDRIVAATMRDLLAPADNVLDLGCGTGLLLDLCPEYLPSYTGVDISGGMLSVAERKWPTASFVRADMAATGLRVRFDAVVSLFGAASYIDRWHWACLVNEVRRLLVLGGSFFLMYYGQGAVARPGATAEATRAYWQPIRGDELRHLWSFSGWARDLEVRPLTGPFVARLAEVTDLFPTPELASLLRHEQEVMEASSGLGDHAYWQIVYGRRGR